VDSLNCLFGEEMFLNLISSTKRRLDRRTCWGRLGLALLVLGSVACAQEPLPACFVELPVYDATGNRVDFDVVSVSVGNESGKTFDLLTTEHPEVRVAARGNRVYFPKGLIGGRRYTIGLENAGGDRAVTRVALLECQQRTPVPYGVSETGADVGWSTMSGHLSGCPLVGDWWVRAMPMFGGQDLLSSSTGYLNPEDGAFWLMFDRGIRHIVIIGKGKNPVRTLGVNVLEGGKNDLGTIDLSKDCPE